MTAVLGQFNGTLLEILLSLMLSVNRPSHKHTAAPKRTWFWSYCVQRCDDTHNLICGTVCPVNTLIPVILVFAICS